MDPNSLLELARKYWHRPVGLLAAIAALGAVLLWQAERLSPVVGWSLFTVGVVALSIYWFRSNRLKRTPKNKVGFVLAIDCENQADRQQVRSDFTEELKRLVSDSGVGHHFWFYEIPDAAERVVRTQAEAKALQHETRAHFVLYGKVRTRETGGARSHIIDLAGLVHHGPITPHNQRNLAKDFAELMPRRVEFETKIGLEGFELTSSIVHVGALYIIGVAAACVGDVDFAAQLLKESLKLACQPQLQSVPFASRVKERAPIRLAEISLAEANVSYQAWRSTKNQTELETVAKKLDEIPPPLRQRFSQCLTLSAVVRVAKFGDVVGAEALIRQCPIDDPATRMNLALIEAEKGNLRGVAANYRAARSLNVPFSTVEEVYEFLDWYQPQSAHPLEIEFAKGFIAYAILKDRKLAIASFDTFTKRCAPHQYQKERILITKWLHELADPKS